MQQHKRGWEYIHIIIGAQNNQGGFTRRNYTHIKHAYNITYSYFTHTIVNHQSQGYLSHSKSQPHTRVFNNIQASHFHNSYVMQYNIDSIHACDTDSTNGSSYEPGPNI